MNVAEWQAASARLRPDAPALLTGFNLDADYATFARRAAAIGAVLSRDYGIAAGDRVALFATNCTQYLTATNFFPVVDHPTEGPIRSMKVSATRSETPAETSRLAPRLNEHGAETLREAGYSADEIAGRVRDGATMSPT
jgi:crotonobetainyl-CoA:carnitine CoA-transferase CaiB-like acyl-CoA transferase